MMKTTHGKWRACLHDSRKLCRCQAESHEGHKYRQLMNKMHELKPRNLKKLQPQKRAVRVIAKARNVFLVDFLNLDSILCFCRGKVAEVRDEGRHVLPRLGQPRVNRFIATFTLFFVNQARKGLAERTQKWSP